jgi:hypothetical protein
VLALGRRLVLPLDPLHPICFAPNQFPPAPNQPLPRQISLAALQIKPPAPKSTLSSPKLSQNTHSRTLDAKPATAGAAARCEMAGKSKRTTAPTPLKFPWPTAQPIPPPGAQPVPPPGAQLVLPPTDQSVPLSAIPSMFGTGSWLPPRPPQSMAATSPLCWLAVMPQSADLSAQASTYCLLEQAHVTSRASTCIKHS